MYTPPKIAIFWPFSAIPMNLRKSRNGKTKTTQTAKLPKIYYLIDIDFFINPSKNKFGAWPDLRRFMGMAKLTLVKNIANVNI